MSIGGILAVLMGVWVAVGYVPTRNIETPKYDVVTEAKGYEIRQYAAHIVAEVKVTGSYKESVNQGFRKIADYIFGNNTASGKIAMTAPVLQEKQPASEKIAMTAPVLHEKAGEADTYTVAFVMPSSYTLETLPKPNNSEVTLREIPEKKFAALSFKGYAPESKAEEKTKELLESLKKDGITTLGSPTVAQYNPPWTPPFMRHNEILVEVQ
ncbi:MAG: heme-binding protein [FCB group bacterium]|nr:heme-binding protein [FCB group bacterium]